eukprot:TRINITY_DN47717_c0_g2_i1.p1 TRINITY_DN47717_c0_g2~~TRINITY_DN47717_c0_g2_i1.p1  ORF type:complete len:119 (+),score=5.38 TRINITY_DN47717_c0_g2_i1:228-584(+)
MYSCSVRNKSSDICPANIGFTELTSVATHVVVGNRFLFHVSCLIMCMCWMMIWERHGEQLNSGCKRKIVETNCAHGRRMEVVSERLLVSVCTIMNQFSFLESCFNVNIGFVSVSWTRS